MASIEQVVAELAGIEARVSNLEGWQKSQNGHLKRIDEKLDRISTWLIGALTTGLISLAMLLANLIALRGGR